MKTFLPLFSFIAATIFLAGCGDSSKPGTAANEVSNVVTAPLNYIGTVSHAEKYSQNVINVSYINEDIQMFNASEGHYPKDLQEMVPTYLGKIPVMPIGYKLIYDTNSWTVRTEKE